MFVVRVYSDRMQTQRGETELSKTLTSRLLLFGSCSSRKQTLSIRMSLSSRGWSSSCRY